MRNTIKIILSVVALLINSSAWTQNNYREKFGVKAYANIGIGNAIDLKSSLNGEDKESSVNDFGVDFGWRFWKKQNHNLELNIGVAYSMSIVKLGLEKFYYNYSASSDADIDGNQYIRYYDISALRQQFKSTRMIVPIYISYGYNCSNRIKVHADLGLSFGFKISSKLLRTGGDGYSFGIYPQYDNLKIEDAYINDFGSSSYSSNMGVAPTENNCCCSMLAGAGVEFKIHGPIYVDLSFRYNKGLSNIYKSKFNDVKSFDENTAPMSYTVKEGQKIRPLTDFLKSSKLSQCALNISLIYRF